MDTCIGNGDMRGFGVKCKISSKRHRHNLSQCMSMKGSQDGFEIAYNYFHQLKLITLKTLNRNYCNYQLYCRKNSTFLHKINILRVVVLFAPLAKISTICLSVCNTLFYSKTKFAENVWSVTPFT